MCSQSGTFDFDAWKQLFETDPVAFETRRQEIIDCAIRRASANTQQRLRGLQWRIDVTRRRYKHPAVSSAKLFEMMWQKVYGTNGLLDVLTSPDTALTHRNKPSANLIQLRSKR